MLTVNDYWTKHSEIGAEVETSCVIAALIRLARPSVVVETGCGEGDTTLQIALALKYNAHGHLYTCDIDHERCEHVRQLCRDLPVSVRDEPGVSLLGKLDEIDFAFIDSGWQDIRVAEVREVIPRLRHNALLVLHDVCQNYNMAYQTARELLGTWGIVIDTPYGLAIFQKGEPTFTHIGKLVEIKERK